MKRTHLFLSAILIALVYSCGSTTPEQATVADSVTAPADTTALMDSSAGHSTIVPEDTIKALKIIYVNDGGAAAYNEMDDNSATASELPYGAPLEVLEEYAEWYKVRFRNNSEIYVFYVLKQSTSDENPVALRLFFPAFQIVLKGFQHGDVYGEESTSSENFYYQEGSDEANLSDIQTIVKDTITLYESMNSYDVIKHIKIVPKNVADRFVVTLAYGQHIIDVTEYTKPRSQRDYTKPQSWLELTPYKILPDTGGIFLPTFYNNIIQEEETAYRAAIAKKYGLEDTSMIIPREYDITVNFVKKGRYFTYSLGATYLRVQRFSGTKLMETRYIVIRQDEVGC